MDHSNRLPTTNTQRTKVVLHITGTPARARFRLLLLLLLFFLGACRAAPAAPTLTVDPNARVPTDARVSTNAPRRTAIPSTASRTTAPTRRATLPIPPPLPSSTRPDPTLTPPSTPSGTKPAPPASDTNIYFETVPLDAYPYEQFLRPERDPKTNIWFQAFDRAAYDAAPRAAQSKTFRAVILENRYLKLTFLPELGGRLYQITYKTTGQNLLYNNHVLKLSPWGMPEQGGWLAAGGIEWAFPTQEHGYEWNAPWTFETQLSDREATIVLRDSDAVDRPRVQIRVTLPAHAANFKIEPRIENPTASPQRLQFWDNAQLNLGAETLSPTTEFIFPNDSVWIHSTGNEWISPDAIPSADANAPAAPVSLSNLDGRDLRFYGNWDNYLGVFAGAELATNFVGAYNHETDLGVARVFPPAQAPGVKLFAFGPNFCCRDLYTDDDSQYFELWGGISRTFFADDDVTLAPGETRTWTEYWLPIAHTSGLTSASADAAVSLRVRDNHAYIAAYSAITRDVMLVIKENGTIARTRHVTLTPTHVWSEPIPVPTTATAVQVQLQDLEGNLIVATP